MHLSLHKASQVPNTLAPGEQGSAPPPVGRTPVSRRAALRRLGWLLCLTGAAWAPARADGLTVKDNVEGSFVQLATFPIRPMVVVPASTECSEHEQEEVWAVNHHDSTVEVFYGTQIAAHKFIGVPWNPVSIAFWRGEDHTVGTEDDRVLVVCRGTWAVVEIDRCSGDILHVYQMRDNGTELDPIGKMAEPGDIVILGADPDQAFVSCSGGDAVIQIDLESRTIVETFNRSNPSSAPLLCKNPLFLSVHEGEVYVAPLTSGNNSIWGPNLGAVGTSNSICTTGPVVEAGSLRAGTSVVDLASTASVPLPDQDLWAITPRVGSTPGSVRPVATAMGTLLFAHGYNDQAPSEDQRFWQLNTEARNTAGQGEQNVAGTFTQSRVSLINALPSSGTVTPTTIRSLDPVGIPGNEGITLDHAVGMPFGLTFENGTGNALVTGLLTNNVAVLDPDGTKIADWSLGSGAIPRQVVLRKVGSSTFAYVYCWGTNRVRIFRKTSPSWSVSEMSFHYALRHDPTPTKIADGRKLFFDGQFSEFHNTSCASCHVEGGTDMLAWNLSNLPTTGTGTATVVQDDKGGMVTQTMVSLARQGRFHWRGERTLDHFNEFAFPGLLGNEDPTSHERAPLSAEQIDQFKSFVFSLTSPANPVQNRARIVEGDAATGQHNFLNEPQFKNGNRCSDCHVAPVGTASDIVAEFPQTGRPRRSHLKVAGFLELWRKEQPIVEICIPGSTSGHFRLQRAMLGAGVAHTGEDPDVAAFISGIFTNNLNPTLTVTPTIEFVRQWDQGLAPAVHYAFLLDSTAMGNTTRVTTELDNYLIDQASSTKRACDVVVIGNASPSRRWYYNRADSTFYGEDGSQTRSLADFKTAASGGERSLFLGVPVGSGERFAVDYDMDGKYNLVSGESTSLNAWDPTLPGWSGSGPAITRGPTRTTLNARVARINLTTDQPTQVKIRIRKHADTSAPWWEFGPDSGLPTNVSSLDDSELATATMPGKYAKVHSILVSNLVPSTSMAGPAWSAPVDVDYNYEVQVTNPNGTSSWTTGTGTINSKIRTGRAPLPSHNFSPTLNHMDYQVLNEHQIDSSVMTLSEGLQSESPASRHVKVDFTLVYSMGATLDSSNKPVHPAAPNRIVVGHVLVERANGNTEVVHPVIDVTGASPWLNTARKTGKAVSVRLVTRADYASSEADSLTLEVDGATGGIGADGGSVPFEYVFGTDRSDTSGAHSVEFDVDGLAAGDVVRFVVDAVVELPPADSGETDRWTATHIPAVTTGSHVLRLPSYVPSLFPNPPDPLPVADDDNGKGGFTLWNFPGATDAEELAAPQATVQ